MKCVDKQEKLKFYQQVTDDNFQKKLQKIEEKYFKIGSLSIKITFIVVCFGMLFSPWIVFLSLPGFITPLVTIAISNKKFKSAVDNLNELFSYEDLIEMKDSGEWFELSKELSPIQPEENKNITQSTIKDERSSQFIENNELNL